MPVLLGDEWWLPLIRGGLALLFADFAFNMPVATVGTLALLVAGYLQSDGVVALRAARAVRERGPPPRSFSDYWTHPATPLFIEPIVGIGLSLIATEHLTLALARIPSPPVDPAALTLLVTSLVLGLPFLFIVIARRLPGRIPPLKLVIVALGPFPTLFLILSFLFGPIAGLVGGPALPYLGWPASSVFSDGPLEFIYGIPALDGVTPIVTLRGAADFVALWAVVRGGALLWTAGRPAAAGGRWLLGLAGLVSVCWGVSLKLYAEPEPAVLMEWLAVYLLLFATVMGALALRRRNPAPDALNPFAERITLRRIGRGLFRATEFVATAAVAAGIMVLLYVLVVSMRSQTIDIGTISVPKEWEERGYTSSVAASRLRDAINQVVADADSVRPSPHFANAGPDVTIHEVWFRPEAIGGWLGNWLGWRQQQDVAGEITATGCAARLRLRYNGNPLPDSLDSKSGICVADTIDFEKIDRMFEAPAGQILRRTDPYLVAVACEAHHPKESRKIIDLVLPPPGARESQDAAAPWFYNLRALIDERELRLMEKQGFRWTHVALEDFKYALHIDPRFAEARNSLLGMRMLRGERDQAKTLLLAIINNNPQEPDARDGRAELMHLDGQNAQAEDQYLLAVSLGRKEIGRDPENPWGYVSTGQALFSLSEFHRELGKPNEQSKEEREEAEAMLRRAVEINPSGFEGHLILAAVLFRAECPPATGKPCKLGVTSGELRKAYELDPDNDYFDKYAGDLKVDMVNSAIVEAVTAGGQDFRYLPSEPRPKCPGAKHRKPSGLSAGSGG